MKPKQFSAKDYINMVFKIKAEEDVFKENKDSRYNPVRRMVSKLLMNSLYSKMQEKKKDESQAFISNNADMHEFLCSRTLNKTLYSGRTFINDIEFGEISVPKGFNMENLKY